MVVQIYYEILFGHKKERRPDTQWQMDEFWKHYAKGKQTGTKVTYGSISSIGRDQSIETEHRLVVTWVGAGEVGGELA